MQKNRKLDRTALYRIFRLFIRGVVLCVSAWLVEIFSGSGLFAVEISDTPLDLAIVSPRPNLMVIVDNAAVMDAEFLTTESKGLFQGKYYLFPEEAYLSSVDHALGAANGLSADQRRDWRARWNGYNHIFYNPDTIYNPWPDNDRHIFGSADLQQPWSDPMRTGSQGSRLNMATPDFSVVSDFQSIVVPVAHYYRIDDLNANGRWDHGEAVYLVVWSDMDNDGVLDLSDDPGNDLRRYYRFIDDGNGLVGDGELVLLTELTEINRIRPAIYDLSGNMVRFKSDREDLQNFTNWVSYYRRRMLSVKAAAAQVFAGLENINMGLYPLNSRIDPDLQSCQPSSENNIIVDDQDPGVTTLGAWMKFNDSTAWGGSSLFSQQKGAAVVYRPVLPASGEYMVSIRWPCNSLDGQSLRIEIDLDGGRDVISLTKEQSQKGPDGCGRWIRLGTWNFSVGDQNAVRLIALREDRMVMADAVQFQRMDNRVEPFERRDKLLASLYEIGPQGDKNLPDALDKVGRYFDHAQNSGLGASPLESTPGGGCQRNMVLLVSDGFWNGSFAGVGNADGNQGTPFADPWPNTLADVAMHYYIKDLAGDLSDLLPAMRCNGAAYQHMVTYGIGLGGIGLINRRDINQDRRPDISGYAQDSCFQNFDFPGPQWPKPETDLASCIDDFWHATVNGRGIMRDVQEMDDILSEINLLRQGFHPQTVIGQPFFPGEVLEEQSMIYQTRYDGDTWNGDVLAFEYKIGSEKIDTTIDRPLWSASQKLEQRRSDPDSRKIISYGGQGFRPKGVPFRYADLSDLQKKMLGSDLRPGSHADQRAADLLEYLRGGSDIRFRFRKELLGDIINSAPLVVGKTLYVGANDGMLHAFDARNGEERFAYVPHAVFSSLIDLASFDYNGRHRFFIDGALTAGDVLISQLERKTYLVGGYGKGGQGYFCLNIRTMVRGKEGNEMGPYEDVFNVDFLEGEATENLLSRVVQWEYPRPGSSESLMDNDVNGLRSQPGEYDPDIGYSIGQGYAVNANVVTEGQFRPVVIFPNGYNSASGRAILYIIDAVSGELIRKIDTGAVGGNGLSSPALIDVNFDRRIDYAYAGDLMGNLWKFDLTSGDPDQWGVAYGVDRDNDGVIDASQGDVPVPVFRADNQAITARPDVMFAESACTPGAPGYMVVFGTGKYLGVNDKMVHSQQSIYGLWDYGDDSDDSEYLGYLIDRGSGMLSSGLRLVPQTVTVQKTRDGGTFRTLSNNRVDYSLVEDILDGDGLLSNNDSNSRRPDPLRDAGWFFDFPMAPHPDAEPGERVISNVAIRGGRAVVISYTPVSEPCKIGGTSWLYLLDGCFNSPLAQEENEKLSMVKIQTGLRFSGRLSTYPNLFKEKHFLSLDQLLVGDSNGELLKIPIDGETWGPVSWRQSIQ